MTPPRSALPRALALLERCLLLGAIVCLGWYGAVRVTGAMERAAALQALDEGRPTASSSLGPRSAAAAPEARVPLAPGTVIGRIEIPRIGLSEVTRSGDDDDTLRSAVGHLPDTVLPGERGNAAFAGHRDTHFRPLRHIRIGDRIVVTTSAGRYEYSVQETRVVPPTDLSVLEPTDIPALTLVTCHPFNYVGPAPNRFIVRATAVPAK